jgi:methionyl aminopeptidase
VSRGEAAITVRNADELARMRRAGQVVAEMHERIAAAIRPGVTTAALDQVARDVLDRRGAKSNFLGYFGYPATICTSPNEVVVHGIPGDRVLVDGDIVGIDCGAIVDGYHGDAAWTHPVGEVGATSHRLLAVGEACLWAGIEQLRAGHHLGDVGHAVQQTAESAGFSVVRDYVGHGIGTCMHEPPDVPNVGKPGRGLKLAAGNVLALEPMVNAGDPGVRVLDDDWTVVTIDGSRSVHFEHTVAVGPEGPEVLTLSSVFRIVTNG